MLEIESLSRSFGAKAAVANISLRVERRAFVGIIGRSGAGKSTLLRMINRLVEPNTGRIRFDDIDVTALHGRQLRRWRARAAMVFQQFNLIGRLDVLTNVLMGRLSAVSPGRALLKWWPDRDKAIALAALEQFGIAQLASRRADHLSGGQQQRVAIARALVQEPELILADEPIASLDPYNARLVMDALQHINKHLGITVICNLHSLDEARRYCDRLVGLAAGKVVFDGTPSALTHDTARVLYGIDSDQAADGAPAPEDVGLALPAFGHASA